jgi:hypothetical protein
VFTLRRDLSGVTMTRGGRLLLLVFELREVVVGRK